MGPRGSKTRLARPAARPGAPRGQNWTSFTRPFTKITTRSG
jgi:hypothetical protein